MGTSGWFSWTFATPSGAATRQTSLGGQDPKNSCAQDPVASCGHDGTCDGNGGCHFHPAGTTCVAAACSGDVESTRRTCNGAGFCGTTTTKACHPSACAGVACGS